MEVEKEEMILLAAQQQLGAEQRLALKVEWALRFFVEECAERRPAEVLGIDDAERHRAIFKHLLPRQSVRFIKRCAQRGVALDQRAQAVLERRDIERAVQLKEGRIV